MKRICSICLENKGHLDFYKNKRAPDGLAARCKVCNLSYKKEWSKNNKEKLSLYHKIWRVREKNKGTLREKEIKWKKSQVARYPEKYKARIALNNAVIYRKITKASNCSACSSTSNIQGHHPDYSKPLEVIWLCISCHRKIDKIKNEK